MDENTTGAVEAADLGFRVANTDALVQLRELRVGRYSNEGAAELAAENNSLGSIFVSSVGQGWCY